MGLRPPLRDTENAIVRRHCILVKDIQATVEAAVNLVQKCDRATMELPGPGICAIVIQNGIDSVFWQL